MEEDKIAIVNVATEDKVISVVYFAGWTAEDLCLKVYIFFFFKQLFKLSFNTYFIHCRYVSN